MDEELISSDEVMALLFDVSDIAAVADEDRLHLQRMQENIERTRRLAERGEARLPPEKRRPPGASNAEWLRLLAERRQAELDRRKSA